MFEWTRAERAGVCGGCAKALAPGEPVRLTRVVGVTRKFIRCQECAGMAPADLPLVPASHRLQFMEVPRPRPRSVPRPTSGWMPYRDHD